MDKEKITTLFFEPLKCTLIALAICAIVTAVLAWISAYVFLSVRFVKICNIAVKIISLFAASFLSLRNEKTALKGAIAGVLFALVTCFLFTGGVWRGVASLLECIVCVVFGVVCGAMRSLFRGL